MLENFRNNLKTDFLRFPLAMGAAIVAVLFYEGAKAYVLPLCPDFLQEWLLFPLYKAAAYDSTLTPLFVLSLFFSFVLALKIMGLFAQKKKK